MYVKVTEEHLRKAVKAGTVSSSTRNPIARAMRGAGFKDVLVGDAPREVHLESQAVKLPFIASSFIDLCFSYGYPPSANFMNRRDKLSLMRSYLPFNIRVPKPDNSKK